MSKRASRRYAWPDNSRTHLSPLPILMWKLLHQLTCQCQSRPHRTPNPPLSTQLHLIGGAANATSGSLWTCSGRKRAGYSRCVDGAVSEITGTRGGVGTARRTKAVAPVKVVLNPTRASVSSTMPPRVIGSHSSHSVNQMGPVRRGAHFQSGMCIPLL